ncbi:MAG: phosphatase domain-containing protein [Rhodothermales bacterium]|nr:phosphatase domain-containing protein [Rhodothermales bacterium]
MPGWKHALTRIAHLGAVGAEETFDTLRYKMRQRLGRTDPVVIQAYRSFGTEDSMLVWGRVLEDEGLKPPTDRDSVWRNLLSTYRRFESDEVPGVRVRARYAGAEAEGVTDREGYFELYLHPTEPLPADRAWHSVALDLLDDVQPGRGPVRAEGPVLVPPPGAAFGIISDVDDTILRTNATSLLKMARLTFLGNAHTRLPFEGVAAFYRALRQGPTGEGEHPLFFVSSSPWNLYDFLVDFCDLRGIPRGPILLRDLGLDREKFIKASHHAHKLAQIQRVLAAYPALPFVLVGDSGQHDPEIYRQVVDDFPGRIRAIYIRDVTAEVRGTEVRRLADELAAHAVPMLLTKDSAEAAEHAAEYGLIHPDTLPDIRAEKAKDEAPPSDAEQLV